MFRAIAAGVKSAPVGVFFEEDRTKLVPQLEERASSLEASLHANDTTAAPPLVTAVAPTELAPQDQSRYLGAHEAKAKGDPVKAWETAKPLFAAYPDVLAVQELRCTLATNVYPFDVARRECERLMKLSTGR
jgi:hypothetical protein